MYFWARVYMFGWWVEPYEGVVGVVFFSALPPFFWLVTCPTINTTATGRSGAWPHMRDPSLRRFSAAARADEVVLLFLDLGTVCSMPSDPYN